MSKTHEKNRVFLYWNLGNLLGWAFISALLAALPGIKSIPGFFAALLVLTIPFGLAQWLVLRRFLPASPLWVITIPVGCFLFYLIAFLIPDSLLQNVDDEAASTLTIGFLILGAMLGMPQWLILRGRLTRAGLWILASALGIGLGFGIVLGTGLINQYESISYTVVVLVYSLTTGALLSWLLHDTAPTYNQPSQVT